jgi:hypothetical protein
MASKMRILLIALACMGAASHGRDSTSPSKAIEKLMKAFEASPRLRSGKGVAHVSEEFNDMKTTSEVRFQFKDRMLRSEEKVFKDAKQIEEVIWGRGPKQTFFYEPASKQASIADPNFHHVDNARLGKDFNPATFRIVPGGLEITQSLTNILKMANTPGAGMELQVAIDGSGILQLRATGESETQTGDITYRFDTTKGCNLIWYQLNFASKKEAREAVRTYQANWKKQGSGWYVTNFTFDHKRIRKDPKTGEPSPWHYHTEGRIDEFVADCEIDDSIFSLASVNLPDGTLVVDDSKGERYRVGIP